MSPADDLRSNLVNAAHRALIVEAKLRISRNLYEVSFTPSQPDPRRKPQNAQKPLHLVESEYEYLKTGEATGSYKNRPDKLESRIKEKTNLLPKRLELLFEDVSELENPSYPLLGGPDDPFIPPELLDDKDGEEKGYITPDQWGDAWLDLMEIHPQTDLNDAFAHHGLNFGYTPAGEFAKKLGQLWFNLMFYPPDVSQESLWIDAIWGFVDGLYLSNYRIDERPQRQREFVNQLVDELETRASARIAHVESGEQEQFESMKAYEESMQRAREEVTHILEEEGIDPLYVRNFVVDELIDSRRMHNPHTDFNFEEQFSRGDVVDLIEREHLREKAVIKARLYRDSKAVREKSGKGPEPDDILKTVYQNEGASSLEIAKQCTKRKHQGAVTESAADLAGNKDPDERPGKVWDDLPILEGRADGWDLTIYGGLLAEHMFGSHLGIGIRDITEKHVQLLVPKLE